MINWIKTLFKEENLTQLTDWVEKSQWEFITDWARTHKTPSNAWIERTMLHAPSRISFALSQGWITPSSSWVLKLSLTNLNETFNLWPRKVMEEALRISLDVDWIRCFLEKKIPLNEYPPWPSKEVLHVLLEFNHIPPKLTVIQWIKKNLKEHILLLIPLLSEEKKVEYALIAMVWGNLECFKLFIPQTEPLKNKHIRLLTTHQDEDDPRFITYIKLLVSYPSTWNHTNILLPFDTQCCITLDTIIPGESYCLCTSQNFDHATTAYEAMQWYTRNPTCPVCRQDFLPFIYKNQ
jgi:hypothetical protein